MINNQLLKIGIIFCNILILLSILLIHIITSPILLILILYTKLKYGLTIHESVHKIFDLLIFLYDKHKL